MAGATAIGTGYGKHSKRTLQAFRKENGAMMTSGRRILLVMVGLLAMRLLVVEPAAWSVENSDAKIQADFVVAPNGRDRNPGTQQQPFATLRRVQQAVREKIRGGPRKDILVLLRDGAYFLNEPLVFGPGDSGTEEHAVTYAAFPGETPVICGGRRITGWRVEQDGTWVTDISDVKDGRWYFRELFVNGERAARARHPNDGWFRVVKAGPDRRTSFEYAEDDVRNWEDVKDVELLFLHDWSVSRVRLSGVDEATRTVTLQQPVGAGSSGFWLMDGFERHPRYALENGAAFLDQPGEWQMDRAAGRLRYRPLPGQSPESAMVIAPASSGLLAVRGGDTPDRFVQNLHFRGLAFEYSSFTMLPAERYAGIQAAYHSADPSQGRFPVPAAVHFERARNCSLRDSVVRHLGGSGVWLGQQCADCVIEGSVIRDVAANGVMIGEDRSRKFDEKPWIASAPNQVAVRNVVCNCLIEEVGRQFHGAVGVWTGIAAQTLISHNTVRRTTYTGISVGWMWNPTPTPCRANRIEFNHIHEVMQILSDGGGIYTLGLQPGSVIRGNCIHGVPLNAGRAESNGMFLDEGTTDYTIEENTIYDVVRSPLRFHRATKNLVRNNVFLIRGDLPDIRYNATKAEHITKIDNRIFRTTSSEDASRLVREAQEKAGPEPALQDKLKQMR